MFNRTVRVMHNGIRSLVTICSNGRRVKTDLPPRNKHEAAVAAALAEDLQKTAPRSEPTPLPVTVSAPLVKPQRGAFPRDIYNYAVATFGKAETERIMGQAKYTPSAAARILDHIYPSESKVFSLPPADRSAKPAITAQPVVVHSAGGAGNSSASTQPGIISRFQLLNALELFPVFAADLTGEESDETLRALLKNASADAGLRLPGDPAEPTPAEMRQSAMNKILAAPTKAVTSGTWNLESLIALTDSVFGPSTAKAKAQAVSFYEIGEGSLAAKMNRFAPGSHQWNVAAEEMRKQARGKLSAQCSPQEQNRQLEALRSFLCCSGVKVPGLSYAGIRVPEAAEGRLTARQLAIAQASIHAFCGVLTGDENAGLSAHPGAAAARRFIAATRRQPFTIGMLPDHPAPAPEPFKGLYGGIPKSGA